MLCSRLSGTIWADIVQVFAISARLLQHIIMLTIILEAVLRDSHL